MDTDHGMSPAPAPDGSERLAASARGWHSIQLAVLGFIGICGVLRAGGGDGDPGWLRWLALGLAVLAFGLACLAIYQVGQVAYPFYGSTDANAGRDLAGATRQLRAGVRMTYLAVGCLALAAVSGWWPGAGNSAADAGAQLVQVRDGNGGSACGTLRDATAGTLRLDTATGTVTVPLAALITVAPVDRC